MQIHIIEQNHIDSFYCIAST